MLVDPLTGQITTIRTNSSTKASREAMQAREVGFMLDAEEYDSRTNSEN
jgi:hypothetical protein